VHGSLQCLPFSIPQADMQLNIVLCHYHSSGNTWNFRLQNYVCNTLPIIISTTYGVGGVVKLTTPYFSHSSHYRVSSIQCFPMQHTQILLQYAMLTKLNHVHIKFNKSLKVVLCSDTRQWIFLKITWAGNINSAGHMCPVGCLSLLYFLIKTLQCIITSTQ
jgi:hypothetical protein